MLSKSKKELAEQEEASAVVEFEPDAADNNDAVAPATEPQLAPPPAIERRNLGQSLRTPAIVGASVVAVFFGGFGGWAVTAPLASATIASGTVSPDTQRKTIQHLEGGIVREVKVREGSKVKAGDVLVTLLDTKASSTFEQDAVQKHLLDARKARYEAELALLTPETEASEALAAAGETGKAGATAEPPGLTFPPELEKAAAENPGVAEILEGERQQFHARMEAYGLDLLILEQAIAKAEADMVQLQRQIDAIMGQAKILDETVAVYVGLVEKGLESRSKLLSYQAQRAALDDDVVSLEVRITGDKESIKSSELELRNTRASRVEQIADELATVRSDRQSIEEKMRGTIDTLNRTVIRSPVEGTVVNLKVHTVGGVVSPGGTVMEIVPVKDELIIDAHIDPDDIDSVHVGQQVRVSLNAIPQREMPIIHGTLLSVSADVLTDSQGTTYYLGKAEVPAEAIKSLNRDISLLPGMEVELYIMNSERTFLDYLLEPLWRSATRSFVEP